MFGYPRHTEPCVVVMLYEWAANKPLTLVDGPNLLALLSKHGYKFKIESVERA